MDRRKFISTTTMALAGITALQQPGRSAMKKNNKLLNAYYFRGHMYTMVPHQVREDMKWMADVGTNAVSIAVLEQDLFAAVENIEIIINEASKLGMEVYAVPSRWAGLFAGAPKVPSLFSVTNPQTWVLKEDGTPRIQRTTSGVISSIHYPETFEFFQTTLDKMFKMVDIKGVIWDEPKLVNKIRDFSPKAVEKLGRDAPAEKHLQAFVDFMSKLNKHIKSNYPDKRTCMFAYAFLGDEEINMLAATKFLDDFGCDGRPWFARDGGKQESHGKVLLGDDGGERFLKAARENNKNSLWLIENHNLADADIPKLQKRLPEVIKSDVDHLIYYYYPRNLSNPDKIMNIIKQNVAKY